MTDTPRTRDELLADIFPDGQTGGITAQDMRDYVVSTMQRQIIGDGAVQHHTGLGAGSWPTTVANQAPDNDVLLALTPDGTNAAPDTSGVVQSGSYVSSYYAQTFPAYTWMRLPPGLWSLHWQAIWSSNSTGFRFIQAETMDDRINIVSPVVSDFWGYPGQWGTLFVGPQYHTAAARPTFAFSSQMIGVPQSLVDIDDAHSNPGDGLAVSFWAHQSSGGPLDLQAVSLFAVRLNSLS